MKGAVLMKKTVYKADQLPSYIEQDCVEWECHDNECNVRINFLPNGKVKLSGEWVKWDEKADDWESRPMSRNEVVEVMHTADLVLPTSNKGAQHMKDKFQAK
jgi:hypothetical protein